MDAFEQFFIKKIIFLFFPIQVYWSLLTEYICFA